MAFSAVVGGNRCGHDVSMVIAVPPSGWCKNKVSRFCQEWLYDNWWSRRVQRFFFGSKARRTRSERQQAVFEKVFQDLAWVTWSTFRIEASIKGVFQAVPLRISAFATGLSQWRTKRAQRVLNDAAAYGSKRNKEGHKGNWRGVASTRWLTRAFIALIPGLEKMRDDHEVAKQQKRDAAPRRLTSDEALQQMQDIEQAKRQGLKLKEYVTSLGRKLTMKKDPPATPPPESATLRFARIRRILLEENPNLTERELTQRACEYLATGA